MTEISEHTSLYSPASLIGLFNNALKLPETTRLLLLKGKYVQGGGKSYAEYYYDLLYSETAPASIGLKISGVLRAQLLSTEVYVLKGFLEKRIRNSSIDLIFVVEEIIRQEDKVISEDDLKRYELIQRKLETGSRSLENFIRGKKLKNETIKIANVYGHSAVVQQDFREGLKMAANDFVIEDFSCNITSSTSILNLLRELNEKDFDIIAIVRGGGDKQSFEAFEDLQLAGFFIELKALTITAIGHTVDETLTDRLADRKFNLPLDYGTGLRQIIEKITEEKSNSRALLIEEIKKDVGKQFVEQVSTLQKQLTSKNEEFQKLQEAAAKQVADFQKTTREQHERSLKELAESKKELAALYEKNTSAVVNEKTAQLKADLLTAQREIDTLRKENEKPALQWFYLLIALVLGLLLGMLLFK